MPKIASWYTAYIHSKYWKALRERLASERGFRCERCGTETTLVTLHHKTYERLGCEQDADLIFLCSECHLEAHKEPTPFIERIQEGSAALMTAPRQRREKRQKRKADSKLVRFNQLDIPAAIHSQLWDAIRTDHILAVYRLCKGYDGLLERVRSAFFDG